MPEVTRMPFGKYKGATLRSIPREYLEWFVREAKGCENVKRSILAALGDMILERAERSGRKRSPRPTK